MSARIPIRVGAASLQGLRGNQEDAVRVVPPGDNRGCLLAVADGLGGHANGELASAAAVKDLTAALVGSDSDWARALAKLDQSVTETGGATTLTALVLDRVQRRASLAWCGDSPAVLIRGGRVAFFAKPHGYGHRVVRCLGANHGPDWYTPEVVEGRLLPGDVWLLASDGLDPLLDDGEADKTARRLLASLRTERDLDALAGRIAQAAIDAGSQDNVTVAIAVVGAA